MKNVYSKYWINARDTIYGFMPYDRSLVDLIEGLCGEHDYGSLLEVAIGTGKPIASALANDGFAVHGIDISPDLVNECRKNNPSIDCMVGDVESLSFPDNHFDLVYCVHSSWYFPDINKAITEMIRVVRGGGSVIFDVQNMNNKKINKIYRLHVFENRNPFGMIYKAFKNTVKFLIKRGVQDWPYVVSQTPAVPGLILGHLRKHNVNGVQIYADDTGSLKAVNCESDDCKDYARLIFVVSK